ncbi:MAG: hypothetical protein GY714_09645 [Desulfobacterales bacterium]|nr:hypothetical protein [Desulfobacterales bacterium]
MKKIFYPVILIISVLFIFGCSQKNYTMLNLEYSPETAKVSKGKIKIALCKPGYSKTTVANNRMSNSFLGAMMIKQMPPDYRLKKKYSSDYVQTIQNSLVADTQKLLQSKGLKIYKTFNSYDEITYSEKKKVDLILEQVIDINPVIRNNRTNIPIIGPKDKGTIQLTGKIKIILSEPVSKERIMIKTIDISSIGLQSSVSYDSADDAENKLVELLNNMYPALMKKYEIVLDVEEINIAKKDIMRLKAKNS